MDIFGLMKNEDTDVMEYMQKMYGEKFQDEFHIDNVDYAKFPGKEHHYYMSSKNMPSYRIDVKGHKGKYQDNYMPHYYIEQYQEYMKNALMPEIGECKVISEILMETSDISPDMGFDEYIHSGKIPFSCVVLASKKMDIEIYATKICNKIKELGVIHNFIMVRVLNDYTKAEHIKTFFDAKDFNTTENPYYSDNTLCINRDNTLEEIEKGIF